MIVGGGNVEGTGIMEKFIELGGGAEKGKFIIVPTAGGNRNRAGEVTVYNEENISPLGKAGTADKPSCPYLQ